MKLKRKHILPILGVVFLLIQFIRIDKTNPPIVEGQDLFAIHNAPAAIKSKIVDACYDCHAHTTKYPWYTNIAPFSWWIKGHIDNGRRHLNFSVWGGYDAKTKGHKLEECIEYVENAWMPLGSYT
ncbi:MAG: heme-binding domain-containing protein, partial [Bacteroidota bacterium]